MPETLAIAGSGTIATGLAAVAAATTAAGEVVLWSRSDASADRARAAIERIADRQPELAAAPARVRIVTELRELAGASFLVEAVTEERACKAPLLARLRELTGPGQVLATTTSSLSIAELAADSGAPERFVGLHVFNPVQRMELVELAFAPEAGEPIRERARALCAALGKTAVEVPDAPGFVVNRLLFPYLFDAVAMMDSSGMDAAAVDRCMSLGAGMPMGPLALLDFVGLDVASAIGEALGAAVPERLTELVADGALGRKARRGFHAYDERGRIATSDLTLNH